jgi:flavin-binding protein dodecin
MTDHIYKKIELVGSSPDSIETAVTNALNKASESIRNIRWLEVGEIRGHVVDGKIGHWQVGVKLGFTLEAKPSSANRPAKQAE